jgi:adhesin/invasin
MRIVNSKIGIGTTTPDYLLTVLGTASTSQLYVGTSYIPNLGTAAGSFLAVNASGLIIATTTPTGSMTYPGAGIALSNGSAWSGSITDNSANWNTAFTNASTSLYSIFTTQASSTATYQLKGSYLTSIGSGSNGQLSYWTGANTLAGVATTTLTENSLALSLSQPISVIGGSASVLSLATSSLFSYPWSVANGGTGLTSGYNNTNWDTAYTNASTSLYSIFQKTGNYLTSVTGTNLDNVWSTTGLLTRTGAATYSTITDSSTNWNTAYTNASTSLYSIFQKSGSYLTTIGSGSNGQLAWWNGTNSLTGISTSTPSFNYSLTSGGSWSVLGSSPTLAVATSSLYTGAINQVMYFTGTNTLGGLTAGSNGQVLGMSAGSLAWVATSTGTTGLTSYDAFTHPSAGQSATTSLMLLNGNATSTGLTVTGSTYLATTGGNVGIGTTTPNAILDVNGNLNIENQGQLRLYQLRANGAFYASLSASTTPAMTANANWTLPRVDGTAGQVLSTNGAGNLDWSTVGGTGTVTSVDMSVPTGLTIGGNPITGAGTLALSLTSGYSIPTTIKQTSWDNKWDLASSTIPVNKGGTGAITLTGCLTGNGTGAITGSGTCNISNASVSSVGIVTPVGLTVSGSPITSSGNMTLAFNIQQSYIPFGGTSGVMATSTSFSWDNTNTRLGIGSSTPYSQLTVQSSTGHLENILTVATSTGATVFSIDSDGHFLSSPTASSTNAFTINNNLGTTVFNIDTTQTTMQSKLFQVATATPAKNYFFGVMGNGHWSASSTVPVVSSCGTSPSITGSDTAFTVTVGSVSATTCTVTFAYPFTYTPVCTVSSQTGTIAVGYTKTASAIILTNAALTSDVIDVHCFGNHE